MMRENWSLKQLMKKGLNKSNPPTVADFFMPNAKHIRPL
jgi:hypothetical protein